jgi:hypothetical protein
MEYNHGSGSPTPDKTLVPAGGKVGERVIEKKREGKILKVRCGVFGVKAEYKSVELQPSRAFLSYLACDDSSGMTIGFEIPLSSSQVKKLRRKLNEVKSPQEFEILFLEIIKTYLDELIERTRYMRGEE